MRLDMHSRMEVVRANYRDYQKAGKKGKKELLDRLALAKTRQLPCVYHKRKPYFDFKRLLAYFRKLEGGAPC